MTMSVTTPIVPTAVPADTGTPAVAGGQTGTDGEFADALAGFLDGGPGTQSEDPTQATEQAVEAAAGAVPVTGADVLATGSALWGTTDVLAALVPTTPPVASAVPGMTVDVAAQTSLAAAAVAPLTGAAVEPNTQPGVPGTAGVPATVTDTSALAAAASPDAALGSTPSAGVPGTAGAVAVSSAPSTTTGPSGTPAEGVDAQAAVTALGLTLTSGTDSSTGADTGSGAGSGGNPSTVTAVAVDAFAVAATDTTSAVGGPAVTSTTSTAPAQAASALAAATPPASAPRPVQVAHQFATQLASLTGAANGVHTMTIQITPDDLGPVQVQVTLTDGVVDMSVLTALEVGRDTITQAAPDLRRYLEAAGLTCNNVEVDLSNDQSSWLTQPDAEQNFEERQSSNGREQAGTPSGDIDDSPTAGAATRSPSSTASGVDLHL